MHSFVPLQSSSFRTRDNITDPITTIKSNFKAFGLLFLATGLLLTGYSNLAKAEQADDDQNPEKQFTDRMRVDALKSRQAFVSASGDGQSAGDKRAPTQEGGLLFPKLDIPKLIQEREQQKRDEYAARSKVDISQIMNPKEISDMRIADKDQDYLFEKSASPSSDQMKTEENLPGREDDLGFTLGEQIDSFDPSEDESLGDIIKAHTHKKRAQVTPKEYRTVTIGPTDMLKEGQMIQVAISDPFNKELFYPTDNLIVLKYEDKHYAVGSYCGYDFTNLATGALLGEKLVCPTCCSAYSVMTGQVDIGPTIRNISSFNVQTRDQKVKVTVPEHIPAFAKKKYLGQAKVDPRTIVVLGDTQESLAAIDALRQCFTGTVVCLPVSQYGQFENPDILKMKLATLTKNETFITDQDFLDKTNVTVIKDPIKRIDWMNREITLTGGRSSKIPYDKLLLAYGSVKSRLKQEYSNAHYLEDRISHQRCSSQLASAKTVAILGGTMDAYQTAVSARDALDNMGNTQAQVILINGEISEAQKNFGPTVSEAIHKLMKEKRISVLMDCKIRLKGDSKIETIYFKQGEDKSVDKLYSRDGVTEYFISPDLVIVENGVGPPKLNLNHLIDNGEDGSLTKLKIDSKGVPYCNMRFGLLHNDHACSVNAVGSCTQYPSFFHKVKIRTDDVKYNIESAFYAAMWTLDKEVEFKYIPVTRLKIGDKNIYHVGEREQPITEVILNGTPESGKFVAFFVYGEEICGFLTCGYTNLHIYLLEAMKQLIMPSAKQLLATNGNFDDIVASVLRMRPEITCSRSQTLATPSVLRAEFSHEIEKQTSFVRNVNLRIKNEESRQQEKLKMMKKKYDKDGINYVSGEEEMGREDPNKPLSATNLGPQPGDPLQMATAHRGHPTKHHKPINETNVNLGGSTMEVNPLKALRNTTNDFFSPKK